MSTGTFSALSIEQVARFPRPGMAVPSRWGFTPDGTRVTYLFSERADLVLSLWERDLETGRRRQLAGPPAGGSDERGLSRAEVLRRERLRLRELGVTDYHFAKNAEPPVLLTPGPAGVSVRVGEGEFRLLEGTAGAIDPRLSPDGTAVAFVRDGDLHVASVPTGGVRQLTSGAEAGLTHGLAEYIAQEELDRAEGYWWSPDSRRVAFEEADTRHIGRFLILHDEGRRQDVESHEFPFPGEENARVRLGVVEVETGAIRWLELGCGDDFYLARVHWRPGGALVVSVLDRPQQRLTLVAFEPATWERTVLLEEEGHPWLNLDHDLRFLEDGSFIRSSERSGFRHLDLHDERGSRIRQLTSGDWVVTGLLAVDEVNRVVFFQGTREGVRERRIYSVSLDGGQPTLLTPEPGWHSGVFDRRCTRFVDVHSSAQMAPVMRVRSASTGLVIADLFDNGGLTASGLGLVPPVFATTSAADGTALEMAIYAPEPREPGRKYPVIVSVYGGPHAQRVTDDWTVTVDLRAQYLAQQGFVVIKLDNRGMANRGLAFESHIDRAMGTVEIDDQVVGVRFVESLGYADGSRVGIYGWSYGGYATCLALMRRPDVFKVGVAGAPVTDWDGYDTAYTERYMGTPTDNPDGYREGSVLTHVGNLSGKLLVVHGLVDENVHFRHTVRLMAALAEAQKDYDVLLFPGERHMPRGARGLEYQERRVIEYLQRHV